MLSLSFLFGRGSSHKLFERSRNCVLTTITGTGHPQARKVRVAACSDDGKHLWFVIPKGGGIAADVPFEPRVMLSVIDPDSQQLVHVSGLADVIGYSHEPLYLAPEFRQGQALSVVSGDADIALLRVDVRDEPVGVDSEPMHRVFRLFKGGPGDRAAVGKLGDT